jgi:hypothetical protein
MDDGRGQPEVFAGAAAETAKDRAAERDVEIAASFSADSVRQLKRANVSWRVEASRDYEQLDERVHGPEWGRRNFGARLVEGERGDGA